MTDENNLELIETDSSELPSSSLLDDVKLLPEIKELYEQLKESDMPIGLREKTERMLESLHRSSKSVSYHAMLDNTHRYFNWVIKLPWGTTSKDNLDLQKASDVLESTHHGLQKIKDRILEYIAILTLQEEASKSTERKDALEKLYQQGAAQSPVLMFVGLPGVGKTSIAYSIARALNRKFIRIPMGGLGSAAQLRGEPQTQMSAEPGMIIKGLQRAQTKNPVILLDEIDRISDVARSDVMGVLLELLDPRQNFAFTDYYINYPFNLSQVLFICSGNKIGGISNAVLDRMEVIQMPGYTDEEKLVIARDYLLPQTLLVTGMTKDDVSITDDVWPEIIRPFGFDAGIRTTNRVLETVVRRCARQRVSGVSKKFVINEENLRDYLPD
ncbi:AAA family ATPase [Patescibacteria group bacterium]|nr:AAA family ATPase [Patescibacteria group bacterium]